ncbi:hypothetical protein D9758_003839 [Tetrapyrgos nigripes]|uniref:Uncharacterized protein n=1 Tax=Tetrapyrgos nigripes TaxID=182062 RepID=A0A8H5LRX4_9AGAR|nr:hypothetical protein D9758_003839 [Tetrapyrgos nigripes]
MSLLGLFIGIGTHLNAGLRGALDNQWRPRRIIGGLPLIPDKPGLWVCAGHNGHARTSTYATHGYSVVSAILSTTTPGLIKLMQGGIWDKARCFELTQDTLQKMKALEVVDD